MDTSTIGKVTSTLSHLVYDIPSGVQVPLLGVSFWTLGMAFLLLSLVFWLLTRFFDTPGHVRTSRETNNNNHKVYKR